MWSCDDYYTQLECLSNIYDIVPSIHNLMLLGWSMRAIIHLFNLFMILVYLLSLQLWTWVSWIPLCSNPMIFISDFCTCKGILSLKQPLLHNSENGGVCRAMYLTWLGPHRRKSWLDRQHARQCSSLGNDSYQIEYVIPQNIHLVTWGQDQTGGGDKHDTPIFFLLSFHNRTPPTHPLKPRPLCAVPFPL